MNSAPAHRYNIAYYSYLCQKNMADNYLENKMEEYRHGLRKPAVKSAARRAGVLSPGLHIQFPPVWIVLLADTATEAAPFLSVMREAGLSVALCCRNGGKDATALAQRLGARLYPDTCATDHILADLAKNGNDPLWILKLRPDTHCRRSISPTPAAADISPTVLAREFLFLIHPEHDALLNAQSMFDVSR